MLVRFNNLKIILNVTEAKPGGILSAMLSPYLFSNNMNDFCKKFNEQVKIYNTMVYFTIYFFCDISEKFYTYFLNGIPLVYFYNYQLVVKRKISIIFLYDFLLYISERFKLSLYYTFFFMFSILETCQWPFKVIRFGKFLKLKIKKYLNIK